MSESEAEFARLLFSREPRFAAGASDIDSLPESSETEVAFAGRSNVGKSSLLNALFGRRGVARVSSSPGCTRQINFFRLPSAGTREGLVLADLPGYGYARAWRGESRKWQRLARSYALGRPSLRRLHVLIDARRGTMPSDREMMDLLDEGGVNYRLTLTKIDSLSSEASRRAVESATREASRRSAAHPDAAATSARRGLGIEELRESIAALIPSSSSSSSLGEKGDHVVPRP